MAPEVTSTAIDPWFIVIAPADRSDCVSLLADICGVVTLSDDPAVCTRLPADTPTVRLLPTLTV